MASIIPKQVKLAIVDGWKNNETLYACLLTNAFPNTPGAYDVYSDLTNELPTGVGGYTGGGKPLTVSTSLSGEDALIDAVDIAWTASTFTAKFIVVYDNGASKKIRAIYDLGSDYSVTNGTFTVQWNASGLIKISSV